MNIAERAKPRTKGALFQFRDVRIFSFGLLFSTGACAGVWYYTSQERTERHKSIARDIERERWRRQQLGLPAEDDDGFTTKFEARPENLEDVVDAKKSLERTKSELLLPLPPKPRRATYEG
jgi:hypothetical protein